ncbi:hypothetical protein CSUI_010792, partial [Cystoisospora suis]
LGSSSHSLRGPRESISLSEVASIETDESNGLAEELTKEKKKNGEVLLKERLHL